MWRKYSCCLKSQTLSLDNNIVLWPQLTAVCLGSHDLDTLTSILLGVLGWTPRLVISTTIVNSSDICFRKKILIFFFFVFSRASSTELSMW